MLIIPHETRTFLEDEIGAIASKNSVEVDIQALKANNNNG